MEGTNSYGAGLTRHLHDHGITEVKVVSPARTVRRFKGKLDPNDAYNAAAYAALAPNDKGTPRTSDSTVEAVRVTHAGCRSALKARTEVITQITSLLVVAPEHFRGEFCGLTTQRIEQKTRYFPRQVGSARGGSVHLLDAETPSQPVYGPGRGDQHL